MTRPKLLLADDSVTIRKVVELTFADEGIDVTTVADSDAAMAKFLEIHPDIVLVDVGLAGTSGYQLCEMIKDDESTGHIPVLLLVGSFEPFDQDAAEKSGADGFLTKPFHSIRDLVNRVHELLGTQRQPSVDNVVDFDTTAHGDDNEDINALYERSFAETVAIESFETVPGFHADDTFSDEIITEEQPDRSIDEEAAEPAPSSAPDSIDQPVDASHHSVDAWLDDEIIEAVSSMDPAELGSAEEDAITTAAEYEDAPAASLDIESRKEFDWSPAAIVTADDENGVSAADIRSEPDRIPNEPVFAPTASHDDHVTEELPGLNTHEMPEISKERSNGAFAVPGGAVSDALPSETTESIDAPPADADPSAELVEMVARRVIERLSDRAIREIAQEAVPRIAEKLMREALEEDRKK